MGLRSSSNVATNVAMTAPRWSAEAIEDLGNLPAASRSRLLDEVGVHLSSRPGSESRKRKFIRGLLPPWSSEAGFWQLRVDPYRIFYDVENGVAVIRAIREKPHGKTTKEIL